MANISSKFHIKTAAGVALAVFLFVVDRYLKSLSIANIRYNIIGEWLKFDFAANYGIAFSLPLGGVLLNLLIIAILVALIFRAHKVYKLANLSQFFVIITIFLGAFSNLYDRLIFGFVVDYINLKFFTVFNLADVMIGCGILAWFIYLRRDV